MLESQYQAELIRKLRALFPGCIVLKNDASYLQGVPDLIILHKDMWACLEVKRRPSARVTETQQYYVQKMRQMSYAAFIYPGNEEEVFDDLQRTFQSAGQPRVSQRK